MFLLLFYGEVSLLKSGSLFSESELDYLFLIQLGDELGMEMEEFLNIIEQILGDFFGVGPLGQQHFQKQLSLLYFGYQTANRSQLCLFY